MQVHQIRHVVLHRTGLIVIIPHNTAPQGKIHIGVLADAPHLQVKDFLIHQRRIIVQGHVNQAGTASCRSCPGTGLKVLPVFKSRFIQVAINDSRIYVASLCIYHFFCSRLRPLGKKGSVDPVFYRNISFINPVRGYQLSVCYY